MSVKVNVEIDCTPEEARRAIGLPDLTPVHDRYVALLLDTMDKGMGPEMLENLTKAWAPMGEVGMNFWRGLLEAGMNRKK
jgi:hypothetical protein